MPTPGHAFYPRTSPGWTDLAKDFLDRLDADTQRSQQSDVRPSADDHA